MEVLKLEDKVQKEKSKKASQEAMAELWRQADKDPVFKVFMQVKTAMKSERPRFYNLQSSQVTTWDSKTEDYMRRLYDNAIDPKEYTKWYLKNVAPKKDFFSWANFTYDSYLTKFTGVMKCETGNSDDDSLSDHEERVKAINKKLGFE
jgi:hypothetical protein